MREHAGNGGEATEYTDEASKSIDGDLAPLEDYHSYQTAVESTPTLTAAPEGTSDMMTGPTEESEVVDKEELSSLDWFEGLVKQQASSEAQNTESPAASATASVALPRAIAQLPQPKSEAEQSSAAQAFQTLLGNL